MQASPLSEWLEAMGRRDREAAVASLAPDISMLLADGSRADGREDVAALIGAFLAQLRAVAYRVTAQWQVQDAWIAEAQASYELTDHFATGPLPRAFIARVGGRGIESLHIYGAHEHPLREHRTGEEGMWVGGRWVPPL